MRHRPARPARRPPSSRRDHRRRSASDPPAASRDPTSVSERRGSSGRSTPRTSSRRRAPSSPRAAQRRGRRPRCVPDPARPPRCALARKVPFPTRRCAAMASSTSSVRWMRSRSAAPILPPGTALVRNQSISPLQYVDAVEDDREPGHLAGLHEGERLERLIQRAEAAGHDHERLRVLDEHRLAGEEVPEVDADVDPVVEPSARRAARCRARPKCRRPRTRRG